MSRTLLVICQVYEPDPAAVGQQVADVAREMARRGWRVVVYTSARGYEDPAIRYPQREERDGVTIRRLPLSSFGKRSLAVRLLGQTGRLTDRSLFVRLFKWMNRFTLARAANVVTLDRFMAERVRGQATGPITVDVVPPWAKTDVGRVPPGDAAGFRRTHGLHDAFVVMYSGNHAIQHPLTTLLDAAVRLESDPRIVFVFVGGGAGKAAVEARIAAGARNLRSLPFQLLDSLRSSLGAADVHAVSMGDEVVGIVHPCKIYGAMAVGRPILFFGPERSHGGEIVCGHSIGWTIPHGDVDGAVRAIVAAATMEPAALALMGENAAESVATEFSPDRLRGRVCDVIEP